MRRIIAASLALLLGATALAGAWWLTTRPLLLGLDWDNAVHLWQVQHLIEVKRDGCGYGSTLWTCGYTAHMALEPLYGVGAAAVASHGGDTLDGLRMVHAVAAGCAAAFLALVITGAGAPWWSAAVIVAAWFLTTDVTLLLRTVEDDSVSLGWTGALLFICTRPASRWHGPTALTAGLTLAAAALTNYPMLVWAPVLIAAAVFYGRPTLAVTDRRRLWGAIAVAGGFATGLAVWGAWLHWYNGVRWSWARYAEVLVMSPNPLAANSGTLDGVLRYIALYPLDTLLPAGWYPAGWLAAAPARWRAVATLLTAATIVGLVWPLRRGLRHTDASGRIVSIACFALIACTLPAAWKSDYTYYERMNHVPFCLAAIAGAALARLATARQGRVRIAAVLIPVLALLVINGVTLARAPRGQSWLARFEATRRLHPQAAAFIYADTEFQPQDYDKLESLNLAIANHLVISPAGAIRGWPFTPVKHVSRDDYLAAPITGAWLSDAAAAAIR